MPRPFPIFAVIAAVVLSGCAATETLSTKGYMGDLPPMRWDHRPEAEEWTASVLAALQSHGAVLETLEPVDIDAFCPAYTEAGPDQRRAFWAGLFSALAKHESTWRPDAAGGGGQWLGLLQIAPGTARAYDCRAQSSAALFDGSANLSCGVRIAAQQVARDNEIVGGPGAWRGVARDWAPFRSTDKVADMAAWTRVQPYCAAPEAKGVLASLGRLAGAGADG